jgi:transposase
VCIEFEVIILKKNNTLLSKERFEIIKPFLDKEKNLIDISRESLVPYSTLKRWVSAYKKDGIMGLERTVRKDKNSFRSVNKEVLDYLKFLYQTEPDLKILDAHKKLNKFLKSLGKKEISYDTVYRIINNLDPFVKKYASTDIKSKYSNQIFEFYSEELDIEIYDNLSDSYKKPFLHIIFDNYSKAICSYYLTFEEAKFNDAISLLRSAILANESNSFLIYGKPEEYILNNFKIQNRELIESIKKELKIDINFITSKEEKMKKFFNDLNDIFLKDLKINSEEKIDFLKFDTIIKKYINEIHNFNYSEKWEKNLEKIEIITKKDYLNILLQPIESNRKINNGIIRYQNFIYKHKLLNLYTGENANITINPFDLSKIKIFIENIYICDAECEELLEFKPTIYQLKYLGVN